MPAVKIQTLINVGSQTGCQFFNKNHTYHDKSMLQTPSVSVSESVCQFLPMQQQLALADLLGSD